MSVNRNHFLKELNKNLKPTIQLRKITRGIIDMSWQKKQPAR
jgi:hypothetical protein